MNLLQKLIARLECEVVGHKLHTEVRIKDYEVITTHQTLTTCSNCGKLFYHSSNYTENDIDIIKDGNKKY